MRETQQSYGNRVCSSAAHSPLPWKLARPCNELGNSTNRTTRSVGSASHSEPVVTCAAFAHQLEIPIRFYGIGPALFFFLLIIVASKLTYFPFKAKNNTSAVISHIYLYLRDRHLGQAGRRIGNNKQERIYFLHVCTYVRAEYPFLPKLQVT